MPTQLELKHAALDRRALANYSQIHDKLVDWHGRSQVAVRALNRDADVRPCMNQFKFVNEGGAWVNFGSAAKGEGVIEIIEWLGQCSRATAAEFLERIIGELNSTPVTEYLGAFSRQ